MRRFSHASVALVLFTLILSSRAAAEPVRITSGFVALGGSFGVDLLFEGEGSAYAGEGLGDPRFLTGALCLTCSPVRTLSPVRVTFSPGDVFDNTSNSSCPGCSYAGDLFFQAPALDITSSGSQAPFMMTGTFSGFRPGGTTPLFMIDVVGQGTLFTSNGSQGTPREEFLLYRFSDPAPVPEPGTWLLAGTALAAMLVRRAHSARR